MCCSAQVYLYTHIPDIHIHTHPTLPYTYEECLAVRKRERERERVCVYIHTHMKSVSQSGSACVCVCVCVCVCKSVLHTLFICVYTYTHIPGVYARVSCSMWCRQTLPDTPGCAIEKLLPRFFFCDAVCVAFEKKKQCEKDCSRVCHCCLTTRGGGLGSSTIFKKFNEPYAPS